MNLSAVEVHHVTHTQLHVGGVGNYEADAPFKAVAGKDGDGWHVDACFTIEDCFALFAATTHLCVDAECFKVGVSAVGCGDGELDWGSGFEIVDVPHVFAWREFLGLADGDGESVGPCVGVSEGGVAVGGFFDDFCFFFGDDFFFALCLFGDDCFFGCGVIAVTAVAGGEADGEDWGGDEG